MSLPLFQPLNRMALGKKRKRKKEKKKNNLPILIITYNYPFLPINYFAFSSSFSKTQRVPSPNFPIGSHNVTIIYFTLFPLLRTPYSNFPPTNALVLSLNF